VIAAPSRGGPAISVLIPTFNEASNLEAAIDSAAWADEILVVDSFSTDDTVEIARRRGARLLVHEYRNSAAQKNWALPQTAHRWAMVLDADERFTPALAAEVRETLAAGPPAAGYVVRRVNHFLGRRIRHCGWDRDRVLRLFDRDRARYQELEVHAEVEVQGKVRELRHPLLHFTYRSVDQYWPKFRRYTDWGASQAFSDGRRATIYHLVGHPLGRFAKMYAARLGFLDGVCGLAVSLLSFYSVFNKYAKLWELGLQRAAGRHDATLVPKAGHGG
jgi:glycosyltransferase involved in cell wall biosynthesis